MKLLLLTFMICFANAQRLVQPTLYQYSEKPQLIQSTHLQPRQPRPKRQLITSTHLFHSGNHKIDGNFFAKQQVPDINLGAGLNYANQNGYGASLAASNTFAFNPVPHRQPGTTVDLSGHYNLLTSNSGKTLDAFGGVSHTFGHSQPQYNAGLRYRFRRQTDGDTAGSQTLFGSGRRRVDAVYRQYNLHTSRRGQGRNTESYGGVSRTYMHHNLQASRRGQGSSSTLDVDNSYFGIIRPQYKAEFRYRF